MDTLTHGLLGATCAQLLFHRTNKLAWIAGGLAAMAPDLDVLIRSSDDPLRSLFYHRQFSHALIFIPFGALLVSLLLMIFKPFRKTAGITFLAVFTGYATHGFLDLLTTYGTLLYWPFSDRRLSWDTVSIIDPFVTVPLLLGLVWTAVHQSRRGVVTGLALAAIFLSLNGIQHHRMYRAAETYTEQKGWKISALRSFPNFASSTEWRALGIVDNQLLLMDVSGLFRIQVANPRFYPLFSPKELPAYVKNSVTLLRDYHIFHWFSDGYLIAVQRDPLILANGLFLIGENPLRSIWNAQFLPGAKHVRMVNPAVSK